MAHPLCRIMDHGPLRRVHWTCFPVFRCSSVGVDGMAHGTLPLTPCGRINNPRRGPIFPFTVQTSQAHCLRMRYLTQRVTFMDRVRIGDVPCAGLPTYSHEHEPPCKNPRWVYGSLVQYDVPAVSSSRCTAKSAKCWFRPSSLLTGSRATVVSSSLS